MSGAISGAFGITKAGGGTLTLGGANSFTGGLNINAGKVTLGNAGALNSTTPQSVAFGAASSGTLSLNGQSVTISGLTGDSTATVQNLHASTASTLTLNLAAGTTSAYSGLIRTEQPVR